MLRRTPILLWCFAVAVWRYVMLLKSHLFTLSWAPCNWAHLWRLPYSLTLTLPPIPLLIKICSKDSDLTVLQTHQTFLLLGTLPLLGCDQNCVGGFFFFFSFKCELEVNLPWKVFCDHPTKQPSYISPTFSIQLPSSTFKIVVICICPCCYNKILETAYYIKKRGLFSLYFLKLKSSSLGGHIC